MCAGVGSVSGYRGLVGPSKPGSELASRHVRSIATGLGNTETKLSIYCRFYYQYTLYKVI